MALPVVFGTIVATSGNLSLLDQNFNALAATIPVQCTAAGTNNIVWTPLPNQATVNAYQNYMGFLWVAVANSNGPMTGKFGSLAALTMYGPDGVTQFNAGSVSLGAMYISYYNSALNGGLGGFTTISAAASSSITLPVGLSQGGTGKTTAAAARSATGLNIDELTTTSGNASYTILATDRVVGTTSAVMTANQTWTLPAASAVNPGQEIVVEDLGGVVGSFSIAVQRQGGDTVNGGTTIGLSQQYGRLIFISDGTSKWNAVTVSPNPTTPAFRNRFINGDMRFDQRFTSTPVSAVTNVNAYGACDRFYFAVTGAACTQQQVAHPSVAGALACRFTGAVGVTSIVFGQKIESNNIFDLNNQTVTLGVDMQNSLLTTVTWTAYYPNLQDSYGTFGSPTRTLIATGTFTVSASMARYTAQINLPQNVTNGLSIELSVGAQTAGTWYIANMQLEAGGSASAFEKIPAEVQLARCQRYYEKSYPIAIKPGTAATLTNANIFFTAMSAAAVAGGAQFCPFKVPKYKTTSNVSVVYSVTTGNQNVMRDVTNGVDVAAAISDEGDNGMIVSGNMSVAAATCNLQWHWSADHEIA